MLSAIEQLKPIKLTHGVLTAISTLAAGGYQATVESSFTLYGMRGLRYALHKDIWAALEEDLSVYMDVKSTTRDGEKCVCHVHTPVQMHVMRYDSDWDPIVIPQLVHDYALGLEPNLRKEVLSDPLLLSNGTLGAYGYVSSIAADTIRCHTAELTNHQKTLDELDATGVEYALVYLASEQVRYAHDKDDDSFKPIMTPAYSDRKMCPPSIVTRVKNPMSPEDTHYVMMQHVAKRNLCAPVLIYPELFVVEGKDSKPVPLLTVLPRD